MAGEARNISTSDVISDSQPAHESEGFSLIRAMPDPDAETGDAPGIQRDAEMCQLTTSST